MYGASDLPTGPIPGSTVHQIPIPPGIEKIVVFNASVLNQGAPVHITHTFNPDSTPSAASVTPLLGHKSLVTRCIEYCLHNKLKTCIGAVGLSYATVYGLLWYLQGDVSDWANWKSELSLLDLTNSPQKEMADELFATIKMRYLPAGYTVANYLDPLVGFINDIDCELGNFERLERVSRALSSIKITLLFPGCLLDNDVVRGKIDRLRYLKQLAVTQLSGYNVAPR